LAEKKLQIISDLPKFLPPKLSSVMYYQQLGSSGSSSGSTGAVVGGVIGGLLVAIIITVVLVVVIVWMRRSRRKHKDNADYSESKGAKLFYSVDTHDLPYVSTLSTQLLGMRVYILYVHTVYI